MTTVPDRLGDGGYLSVTTYRRDGTAVATPVWVVRDGDALAIWTTADAGKVKRIRNNPAVSVAACDMRGRLTGEPVPGHAELMSPAETGQVRDLIRRKYGVLGRLTMWGSLRRRGPSGTVGIRITVPPPATGPDTGTAGPGTGTAGPGTATTGPQPVGDAPEQPDGSRP